MKILIFTCGVGIGHASRDLALAEQLKEHGHQIEFASYGSGLHYYQKNNYKPYHLPEMNFQASDGGIDVEESLKQSKDIPFTFLKSMYKEAKIVRKIKPDLILTDSDYSAPIMAKFLNIPCYIITNDLTFGFSDSTNAHIIKYFEKSVSKFIMEISKGCQKILVPDIPGSIEIPEQLKNKSQFIGPLLHKDVDIIESKEKLREKYNVKQEDTVIVVTIGGSNFGKKLLTNICEISDKIKADKIFMFTGLEINPNSFNIPENDEKIIIRQFTYDLIEWMKLSDLTIAIAGHTTSMELLSIKKPNILIPLNNHVEQEKNIARMMEYNITEKASINNKEELLTIINNTLDNLDQIEVNKESYEDFIQYNGKENALKLIENVNI
ncbi:MAG: UDP-N-acetylglucosamine--N-acetylmuramyl-(pentapeptide) pyrophosphoryl-undecaprenol N-acetylglucosamine transferase [Methanobacteriaceae archaeon]|nr:UDP-N-acetylglucosamine--N-acetylmuramyl-(pentapeptide) pyrophosphoryl-undecaprenol N-acetylglucosamine transferase [Methanobacteriaceae archaeon]